MNISIVTPSLNQAKFIGQTIDSIVNQRYSNYEHIIMDGGSTDGTLSILRKYKHSKLIWQSGKDKGQANAINKGLKIAKGDIVGFLNSDDYYHPGAFATVAAFFEKHPEVMWMTGDCQIVNEMRKEIQTAVRMYKKILRYLPISLILPITNPIAQPSTFWRREAMERVGFFDETLRFAFDYDYWLRLAKYYAPAIISRTLSSFRIHRSSKGGNEYVHQFKEEQRVIARYTGNPLTLGIHAMHNRLIISVYNTIKS